MAQYLIQDSFPTEKLRLDESESKYQEILAGSSSAGPQSSLVSEIAKARQQIQQSLDGGDSGVPSGALEARIVALEEENVALKKTAANIESIVKALEKRVALLEGGSKPAAAAPAKPAAPAPGRPQKPADSDDEDEDEDDDDFDLFGEDDEDDEAKEKLKEERVAAYNAKKSKKPALIAKSSVLLDVKPWDDETDMAAMEAQVRTIVMDGLLWGASKLMPVGYGIKKLQIMCVVEDEKVSVDDLIEKIEEFEDYVQSVDIAAFSKI